MHLQPRLIIRYTNPRLASKPLRQLPSDEERADDFDGMAIVENLVKPREQILWLCHRIPRAVPWNEGPEGVETERRTSSGDVLDEIEADFPFKNASFLGGGEPREGKEGNEEG